MRRPADRRISLSHSMPSAGELCVKVFGGDNRQEAWLQKFGNSDLFLSSHKIG